MYLLHAVIALLWIVNFTYIVQFTLASHIMFFNIHHHQRTSTHTLCTVVQCTVCSVNSVHGTSQYLKDICHNPMFENAPLKDRWRLSHTAPAALPRTRQDVPGHENILSDVPTSWLSHCIVEYDRSTWLQVYISFEQTRVGWKTKTHHSMKDSGAVAVKRKSKLPVICELCFCHFVDGDII